MRLGSVRGTSQARARRGSAAIRRTGQRTFSAGLVLVVVAMLAIPVALAAKEKDKRKKNGSAAPANLVWPAPPQRPRIRYLG